MFTVQEGFTTVVNAANAQLRPGEAVLTRGHNLPNRYVIHCLGPVYGVDEPAEELLASCYRRALELAEAHQVESIAFSAISAGAFGYLMEEAAEVALKTIIGLIPRLRAVKQHTVRPLYCAGPRGPRARHRPAPHFNFWIVSG